MSLNNLLLAHTSSQTYFPRFNSSTLVRIICICGGILLLTYFYFHHLTTSKQSPTLYIWHAAEQKIKRPVHFNRDHGFCGSCPPEKQVSTAWQLQDIVTHLPQTTPFLLNIGAASNDGGIYDPTYPLLNTSHSSFGALLIDPNTDPSLFSAYPRRSNIRIVHDYIWPESIVSDIFIKYNVPKNFTLLKVDIDSYECSLLDAILRADYRPQVIHTEFNPIFPPPVIFMPIYDAATKHDWQPPLWANLGPFYGCSLSALSKVLHVFDYVLVEVDFWDVVYVQREIVRKVKMQVPANDVVAYEHGFANHACSPYCRENLKLYNSRIADAIKNGMAQSDFTAYMRSTMNEYAPRSIKAGARHLYTIAI